MNDTLINKLAIPILDRRDNYFSIYWINIFLSAARTKATQEKHKLYADYFEIFKQSYCISGNIFDTDLTFQERILIYYATNLIVICRYQVKTARTIVYSAIPGETFRTSKCPKNFYTLNDIFKGATKVFRKHHPNMIIFFPGACKLYNATMR